VSNLGGPRILLADHLVDMVFILLKATADRGIPSASRD